MKWFDSGKGTAVRKALFAERVPSKKAMPSWLAGGAVRTAPLEKWLSSRPEPYGQKDSNPAPGVDSPLPRVVGPAPVPRFSIPAAVETKLNAPESARSVRPVDPRAGACDALRSVRPQDPRAGAPDAQRSVHPLDPRSGGAEPTRSAVSESLRPAWAPTSIGGGAEPPSSRFDQAALAAVRMETVTPTLRDAARTEEYERRLVAATEALEASVEEVATLRSRVEPELERQLVALASLIARRVIGCELSVRPELVAALALEGMDALGERDKVVVRIGPLPESSLDKTVDRLRQHVPHCEVIVDPLLAPGQCVVRSEFGQVDESIDARLGAVLDGLVGQSDAGDSP